MVQSHGIDVYLTPFGNPDKRYPEHAIPPTSPAFTRDPNEVYVEAANGERFIVVVDLLNDFQDRGSDFLSYERQFQDNSYHQFLSYGSLKLNMPPGSELKGRHIDNQCVRKIEGRWSKCGYVFGRLETGKPDLYMPKHMAFAKSARRGHGDGPSSSQRKC